jgi:threo-3-hydroxy-L-aspartate ammonia-lyase
MIPTLAEPGSGSGETSALVTLEAVEGAAARIQGLAVRTPLLRFPELSERAGAEVALKPESLQRAGSFKFRGASHYLSRLPEDARAQGVITYSSGNHAQAVALSATLAGVRSVVVMPVTAPAVKREGAAAYGAEVVLEGTTSLERKARAEAIAAAEGLHMIPPFDDPWIIAGQGTAALEAATDWPEMDTWVVCVGGGGLASGSAVALRGLEARGRGRFRIVGVEPEGAAAMRRSLDAGAPVTLESTQTIADGLAPVRPGALTFRHVEALFDDVVTVSDEEIRQATRLILLRHRLLVEFSGAAALAALLSGRVQAAGRRVGVILSGGNMDPSLLQALLSEGGAA